MQKRIWVETGNRLGVKPEDWNEKDSYNYLRFASTVGWYDDRKNNEREFPWDYNDYMKMVTVDPKHWGPGGLPWLYKVQMVVFNSGGRNIHENGDFSFLFSRCDL